MEKEKGKGREGGKKVKGSRNICKEAFLDWRKKNMKEEKRKTRGGNRV